MTYAPTSVTPLVTDAVKRAVWDCIAPPAQRTLHEIAALTGIDWLVVAEAVAMARGKGRVEINEKDRQRVVIERVKA